MFFCKYAEIPSNASLLTFAKMVLNDGKSGKEHMGTSSLYDTKFSESRKQMYTIEGLKIDSEALTASSDPAPVSAPVQASSSLEDRVARLETAVAALQNK